VIDVNGALRAAKLERNAKRIVKMIQVGDAVCLVVELRTPQPDGETWAYVERAPDGFEATFWASLEAAVARARPEARRAWS
jgi:hypothetical protein